MIKYLKMDGYINRGEVVMFEHVYQFVEKKEHLPNVIILYAYQGETIAFKGQLLLNTKEFSNVDLSTKELEALEPYVGKVKQVSFDALVQKTFLINYEEYAGYKEIKEAHNV